MPPFEIHCGVTSAENLPSSETMDLSSPVRRLREPAVGVRPAAMVSAGCHRRKSGLRTGGGQPDTGSELGGW